jgi:AcrR family transcriptional regulator
VPRPPKASDAALLDGAVALLWRDGADAVSIRDLEAGLGVRAPSLYRRFSSRAGLVARAVDHYTDTVVAGRVARYLDGADDPVAGLHAFLATTLVPFPGEDTPRGCLLTVTAGAAASTDPAVGAAVTRGLAVIGDGLSRCVGRLAEVGRLRPGTSPEAAARLLLAGFEGLVVLARTGRTGLDAATDALVGAVVAPAASLAGPA